MKTLFWILFLTILVPSVYITVNDVSPSFVMNSVLTKNIELNATESQIEKKIQHLTHKKKPEFQHYAKYISKYSKKYNVNPNLVLGVLMTESTFRQDAVSYTGDYGIGQINPRIWSKEFSRLGLRTLDVIRLRNDPEYAIDRTVEIMALMKDDSDPFWVGKYHSKTPHLKYYYAMQVYSRAQKDPLKEVSLASSNP